MSLEGGEAFSLRTPPLLPRWSSWQRELRRPKRFSTAACVGAKLNAFFLVVNFSRNFRGLQNAVKLFALLEQACCFRKVCPAGFAYRRGKTRQPP